jgi:glucose/arabinose dehydrogenase
MRSTILKVLAVMAAVIVLAAAYIGWTQYSAVSDRSIDSTEGLDPTLVEPDPQTIPGVSLPEPTGWAKGAAPAAAEGLRVTRFAEGLDHPRTMLTLPNGDVLVALTSAPASRESEGGITGFFKNLFMSRVGANNPSPDKIVLLRDTDGDGRADRTFDFRTADMQSPSGMAYGGGRLYIANHDAVLAWSFTPGPATLEGKPRRIMNLPGGGDHWMRSLLLSPDGEKLYVAVGSATNIADDGMEAEAGRAAIWEIDTATGKRRQYAAGMRNPNGLDWNPASGELWATVQERDMLGSDLVPDYLSNVPVGVHYGWPWIYWKNNFDDRVDWDMQMNLDEYTRRPEYAMGAHTAVLGMTFAKGGNRLGERFANGAFIARHGSWNRKPASGYDVVFVGFDANGNPLDAKPVPVLTGFLAKDGKTTNGRPTWVAWDRTGALLVSDDTAGIVWRVERPGAAPTAAIRPVEVESMAPVTQLKDPSQITPEDLLRSSME